jgi:hypothetical protein
MAGQAFLLPYRPALTANAIPVVGARLEFYVSQLDVPGSPGTSTPQEVFADEALTISLGAVVEANSAGVWPTIYLDKAKTYRVVLRSPDGEVLRETDPYVASVVDNLAPEIAADAALAARSAGEAEGFAMLLALTSGGYVSIDDSTPPPDVAEGEAYLYTLGGRFFMARKVAGAPSEVVEFATAISTELALNGLVSAEELADVEGGALLSGYKSPLANSAATTVYASIASRKANAMSDFGAKFDNNTDDTLAIQRGINALSARGGGQLDLPAGSARIGTLVVPQDVMLVGHGKTMTQLHAVAGHNAPIIDRAGSEANIVNRGGVQALTIRGSGKENFGCIGINSAFTNRSVYRDIDIFSTREGMRITNVWQEVLDNIHVHGGGGDQSYIGFRMMPRLAIPGISNAVIATGCMAQNVEAYGWRLENANGSKFSGCEGTNGIHAWYLGDPSSGNEAFEFCHFVNCLGDTTSGDIWRMEKGAANAFNKSQYTNCWAGTSFNGSGVKVAGCSELVFAGWQVQSTYQHGFYFFESSRCTLTGSNIRNWNQENSGSCGVYLQNSQFISVSGNQSYSETIGLGVGVREEGSCDFNTVTGNAVSVGVDLNDGNGSVQVGNVSG